MGVVERLTLGYTMLRTLDDRLIIVPNSLMASQVSLNRNRRSLKIMAVLSIGIKDVAQTTEVRAELGKLARNDKRVHRVIGMRMQPLDEGGGILSFRAWCVNKTAAEEVQKEYAMHLAEKFTGDEAVFLAEAA